jgi:hypothetical protein
MLNVAAEYREVIDDITANKSLKLRQYELDDEGWDIIKDLLRVLKVNFTHLLRTYSNIFFRCIRRRHSSFLKTP